MDVYADMGMGSLSLNNPSYGGAVSEENERAWGFPFMGSCSSNDKPGNNFEERRQCDIIDVNDNNNNVVRKSNGSDCSDGCGEKSKTLIQYQCDINLNEEFNPNENSVGPSEKDSDGGQTKTCARGHWRPAEDTKLKELVALYGPQNWNLIAEKLEGRSGSLLSQLLLRLPINHILFASRYFVCICDILKVRAVGWGGLISWIQGSTEELSQKKKKKG